jgi:stromal membrane-associated protein
MDVAEKQKQELRRLMRLPENTICADCTAPSPQWASFNLGIFICMRCAGHHRNLGRHISKVKSTTLDKWTPEQVEPMRRIGNGKAATVYEAKRPANVKKPDAANDGARERYIKDKYSSRKWWADNADAVLLSGAALAPATQQSAPVATAAVAVAPTRQAPPKRSVSLLDDDTFGVFSSAAVASAAHTVPRVTQTRATPSQTHSAPSTAKASAASIQDDLLALFAPSPAAQTPTTKAIPAASQPVIAQAQPAIRPAHSASAPFDVFGTSTPTKAPAASASVDAWGFQPASTPVSVAASPVPARPTGFDFDMFASYTGGK